MTGMHYISHSLSVEVLLKVASLLWSVLVDALSDWKWSCIHDNILKSWASRWVWKKYHSALWTRKKMENSLGFEINLENSQVQKHSSTSTALVFKFESNDFMESLKVILKRIQNHKAFVIWTEYYSPKYWIEDILYIQCIRKFQKNIQIQIVLR